MLIEKARESLMAAELCFGEKLYNSTVSRAYYAMFQAAVVALESMGIQPAGRRWSHEGLQATFSFELTIKRKLYQRVWTARLPEAMNTRNEADYEHTMISEKRARLTLAWARGFVEQVERVTGHERRSR